MILPVPGTPPLGLESESTQPSAVGDLAARCTSLQASDEKRTGPYMPVALLGGSSESFGRLSTLACSLTIRLPPAPTGDTDLIQTD